MASPLGYMVKIDGTGTPDTFKWSDDYGATWEVETVDITGAVQDLNNGVKIKFDNTTGHTIDDYWTFFAGDGIYIGERLLWYYRYYGGYGGTDLALHNFHPGSSIQEADTRLQEELPEWNETMRNTAYSYFRLIYHETAWKSLSDYMIVAKGRKIYDPRDESTAFSRNPALVWLDFMTSTRYGLSVPIANIDLDSVEDVANWCDDHEYTFDGVIIDRQAFGDHMEQILINFQAFVVWSQGKYYLKVYADDAPVMSLTEDEIDITPESFKIDIPGVANTYNVVKCTFSDKENFYTANFATRQDLSAISYSGDPNVLEITLIGTTGMEQGQKIAEYQRLRNKFNKEFTFNVNPRAWVLDPGDMILVTHSFPKWVEKKLRIKSMSIPQRGVVTLNCLDEDPSIYVEP